MGDPGAVEAVACLARLVLAHLRERVLGHLRVAAVRDERRHPAHRERAALVARLDEQLGVGAHERHGHRHRHAVGQHEVGAVAELLDHAEDVVPAAGVQPGRVLAQLVEDLLHLERGEDRLDQDGRADRAARDAERVLRVKEHVVPEPRLEVALQLRQVEVRAAAAIDRLPRRVEHVQAEVEQAAGDRLAVDEQMALREVPAARADEQRRRIVVQAVALAVVLLERDRPFQRVDQVLLALDHVRPGRRVRVLEVGHEHARARVERVDHHLAVGRPGDLDAAVLQVGRRLRDPPRSSSRTSRVSSRKTGISPASSRSWRAVRAPSSSSRRAPNARCSSATNSSASAERIRSSRSPRISTPSGS